MPDRSGVEFLEGLHHALYRRRFADEFDAFRAHQWKHLESYPAIDAQEPVVMGPNGIAYTPWGLSYYPGGMQAAARALITAGRYSKYEDPRTLLILDRVWADLREIYDQLTEMMSQDGDNGSGMRRLDNMVVGTLDHMSFNAVAVRPDAADHYLVLLHQGLFKFLSRMARLCMCLSTMTPVDKFEEIDWNAEGCIAQYRALLEETICRADHDSLVVAAACAILEYFGLSSP